MKKVIDLCQAKVRWRIKSKSMKNIITAALCMLFFLSGSILVAQSEPFIVTELNQKPSAPDKYRLGHPFEIIYGPDNYLYITEKVGRILRIDTATGIRRVLLDHRANVYLTISRNASGVATGIGQDGMMGMALHPNFSLGTNQDSIFVAYSYAAGNVRISRFKYNAGASPTLSNETILISGIPSSNDHSSGRLITGADNKLYYTCGDRGSNQFSNRCNTIRSQNDPTSSDVAANNYANYSGKILRLNFDGSIPSNNPLFSGVRSHIYSKGHRNPQGLVFEKIASSGTSYPAPVLNGKLFSTEHGPRTDDELNIIESGRNYGWPYIAGDSDNVNYQYVNWSSSSSCASTPYTENAIPAGAIITQELDAPASVKTNFRKPILSMHTSCGTRPTSVCDEGSTSFLKFSTLAPSSVDYYNIRYGISIPSWYPSVLITTLKKGTLYRVKLTATKDAVATDTIPYFHTTNRYRDVALSSDGLKIFIITDSIGSTSGPTGSATSALSNPGSIMVYQYNGATLALRDDRTRPNTQYNFNVYPNPASTVVNIEVEKGLHKPLSYYLYDITGKLILTGSSTNNTFKINVASVRRGMYIAKVVDGYNLDVFLEKVILH